MESSAQAATFRPLVLRFSRKGTAGIVRTSTAKAAEARTSSGLGFDWAELVTQDSEVISQYLRAGQVAVLVVDQDLDPQLVHLTEWVGASPGSIRILISEHADLHLIRQAINRGRIYRIAQSHDEVDELVEAGLREFHREIQRVELVRESARQNRELEELTLSLESRVEERTQNILVSKEQEEDKLNRIRRLVKFIKQMTQISSIEELLSVIRNDLRGFHHVVSPILIFPVGVDEHNVVYFSKTQIQLRTLGAGFRAVKSGQQSLGGEDDTLPGLLANVLVRPVAKLLRLEIELQNRPALLVVEHTGNARELKALENHLIERRKPFGMSLDRLLLEMENNFSSYRWEKTFDNLKSPISIIDRQMSVLRSNRQFNAGAGAVANGPTEHRRGSCHRIFAGREALCEGCPVPQVMETGLTQTGVVQAGGQAFEVHSYPIHLQHGGPITNIVNIYVDITPQRELQRRLLQNEKMSAIGLLAGNIAHELNNPLTGLRSLAQVLALQVEPEGTMAQDLKEIEKASARCQTIIRNLLDFTTPGAQPLQTTTMDAIVEKTLPFLKSMLRNHRLDLQLHAEKANIEVEPNLIQQVVFNLINNACQAMKKSGTLGLETRVQDGEIVLTVSDTGGGIPPEVQSRIFEPFFTTKSEGHGTGLGLSLSKEIVEKFGGRIGFETEPGTGTRFFVRLPVKGRA